MFVGVGPSRKIAHLYYETEAGVPVWFNVADGSYTWTEPSSVGSYSQTRDVENHVHKVVAMRCPAFVSAIVKLQRLWTAVKIQSWWRGIRASRLYRQYKEKDREVRLQREIKDPFIRHTENIHLVVRIQRAWRRYRARNDMKLLKEGTPSIPTLHRFLHLLNLVRRDFDAETLLQEVLAHDNKVNKQMKSNQSSVADTHLQSAVTLLCHTKAGKQQLQQYEQLFSILQTQPRCLAKLLFLLPPNKSSRFLEETVLSIFNYGADAREEYLLLRLFQTALEEEIFSKIEKVSDIATSSPLVIRLVVKYSRKGHDLAQLRELLGPLVQSIIDDKSSVIYTNPVEVYKAWVSQTEYKTGQPMGLPHQVTQDQALKQQEVQKQLNSSVQKLRNETVRFLKKVTEAPDNLPYGILYMAKVMNAALEKKFNDTPEKEVLKPSSGQIEGTYLP